tara:strand:- start:5447 stop:5584 length:138 start_codon:yes stop_codon:yes gene_type:complete
MSFTNSPWGKITSVTFDTGNHDWSILFGNPIDKNNDIIAKGSINF